MAHMADYNWVYTSDGRRLHHPRLNAEQYEECEQWGGIYDEEVTLDCGRKATTILIPGVLSRMSTPRCRRCCDITGLPQGKGSPKNDDRCRTILGMDHASS